MLDRFHQSPGEIAQDNSIASRSCLRSLPSFEHRFSPAIPNSLSRTMRYSPGLPLIFACPIAFPRARLALLPKITRLIRRRAPPSRARGEWTFAVPLNN